MSSPIITLTTDFGSQDAYVAAMKGVILGINLGVSLVDVSHSVPPQDVAHGAFVLGTSYLFFPPGSIHIAVVDPGVGTSRRAILLSTQDAWFLAPDNGLLTYVLRANGATGLDQEEFLAPLEVQVPSTCAAFALTNPDFWRHPVSQTFHGRDIFAPVAAHLSKGGSPDEMGERVDRLVYLNLTDPVEKEEALEGHIIHIDHFGNLVSNIPADRLPAGAVRIAVAGRMIQGISPSYVHGEELLAIVGSHGYLEVSVRNGSAQAMLGAKVGQMVEVVGG